MHNRTSLEPALRCQAGPAPPRCLPNPGQECESMGKLQRAQQSAFSVLTHRPIWQSSPCPANQTSLSQCWCLPNCCPHCCLPCSRWMVCLQRRKQPPQLACQGVESIGGNTCRLFQCRCCLCCAQCYRR